LGAAVAFAVFFFVVVVGAADAEPAPRKRATDKTPIQIVELFFNFDS
jgi:hypothetical protein